MSQAALREEAELSEASSAVESAPEESSQGAVDFAVSYYEEPQPITEEEAAATLESLRDTFPEGAYWNHVGVEDWDEFTVTDSPCQHDLYWDAYCNTYTGGIQELFPQFEPMEQCLGFAALLSDLVFGEDAPVSTFTDYTQLRVGDNIRLELTEHSMVVLTVDGEGITWWSATAITSTAASAGAGSSAGMTWPPPATRWSASPATRSKPGKAWKNFSQGVSPRGPGPSNRWELFCKKPAGLPVS